MKITPQNENEILKNLIAFYRSEIAHTPNENGEVQSLHAISLQLGKKNDYIWNLLNRGKTLEPLREAYYLCYPSRRENDIRIHM